MSRITKMLRFLAVTILFITTSTSLVLEANLPKKSCTGQVKINCTGSCQWRNGKCRDKIKKQSSNTLKPAVTGTDASKVSAGSIIMYNMVSSPSNAIFIFYDTNQTALTKATILPYSLTNSLASSQSFTNRPFVIVPTNAKFMDVIYPDQNSGDVVKVCDMQPLNISSSALPQVIFDPSSIYASANNDPLFYSFSSTSAVIVYNFVLNMEAIPPIPASGALLFIGVFDLNNSFMPVSLTTISQDTILANTQNDPQAASYQSFNPAAQFAGQGLVGQLASDGTAQISDPSGNNPQSYSFISVQSGGINTPTGLTLIGKITSRPQCSGTICSNAVRVTNLYGMLQQ